MPVEEFMLELSQYQLYALLFLLGSLTVASISDLKNMSAQKEFFQFWAVFTAVLFVVDAYPKLLEEPLLAEFWGKWILIALVSLLSWKKTGVIFKLARMDVAAVAAVASLFDLYPLILFYPLLKVVSVLEAPLISSERRYPFLPVLLSTSLIVLLMNLYFI
ncbi:MAG: hypothetical protein ACLFM9_01990 [Candidatus Aenigmatarchaeota archaeon]